MQEQLSAHQASGAGRPDCWAGCFPSLLAAGGLGPRSVAHGGAHSIFPGCTSGKMKQRQQPLSGIAP